MLGKSKAWWASIFIRSGGLVLVLLYSCWQVTLGLWLVLLAYEMQQADELDKKFKAMRSFFALYSRKVESLDE